VGVEPIATTEKTSQLSLFYACEPLAAGVPFAAGMPLTCHREINTNWQGNYKEQTA